MVSFKNSFIIFNKLRKNINSPAWQKKFIWIATARYLKQKKIHQGNTSKTSRLALKAYHYSTLVKISS
jgi:hypothetical protein